MDDDRRQGMSRTVLKGRDRLNHSQLDDIRGRGGDKEISVDGVSVSGYMAKPRANSNLRTYDNGKYAQKIELSSIFKPKRTVNGLMTPAPKKGILDELPWEDHQKIMGFSMAKINNLRKDDILRAVNLPDNSGYGKVNLIRRFDEGSPIDEALKKIARAGEDFVSMKDYARALIKRFDTDNDGVITF